MRPLTFSPGPSKLSPDTYADMITAAEAGFLEVSHRSQAFYEVSDACLTNLRSYLGIPTDYHILFLDSATSAWHSIIANAVATHSSHIVNGAFSKKAHDAATKLYKASSVHESTLGTVAAVDDIAFSTETELITICYNESSTGAVMARGQLEQIRERYLEPLLAVDITSAAAAIALPIEQADIWYFSVQKGFGLPAGLGVLILSPRALARSAALEHTEQNLAGIWRWSEYVRAQQAQAGQTLCTPNMLAIYLLNEQLKRFIAAGGIETIESSTQGKITRLWELIDTHPELAHFVPDQQHRSPTVITVAATADTMQTLHQKAAEHNVVLGAGYGSLKDQTFRLANFPAITMEDVVVMADILTC